MGPGPVFGLELRRLSRRRRYYALMTLYGLTLLYVVWNNDPQRLFARDNALGAGLSPTQWTYAGQALFEDFAFWQSIVVVLLVPGMVAGVIAEEKERKTLPILLTTPLTSAEIVLGKLAARLVHLACFLALGLPILMLVAQFGGVDRAGILAYYAAMATTGFLLASMSILISTFARRSRDAILAAYLIDVGWHVLIALGLLVILTLFGPDSFVRSLLASLVNWLAAICPLYVELTHTRGVRFWDSSERADLYWMMFLQIPLGALLAGWAVARFRSAFRDEDSKLVAPPAAAPEAPSPPTPAPSAAREAAASPESEPESRVSEAAATVEPAQESVAIPSVSPPGSRRRPACGDDPVAWKEKWATPPGRFARVLGGLSLALILCLVLAFCVGPALMSLEELLDDGYHGDFEHYYHRHDFNLALRYLATILASLTLLWIACASACSIAGERDQDTLNGLLATPLSAWEIVRGKVAGVFWGVRAPLALWLLLVVPGVVLGAVHPVGFLAALLATTTFLLFGCALGMTISLHARSSSRAVVWTLIVLVILNGGYLILLVPWEFRARWLMMGLSYYVEGVSLLNFREAEDLLDLRFPSWDMLADAGVCAVSVGMHALAATMLALWTVRRFNRVVGRTDDGASMRVRREGERAGRAAGESPGTPEAPAGSS